MTLITTKSAAGAWRPDTYTFAPEDAVPDALINLVTTVSGQIEGDAPSVRVAYIDDAAAQISAEELIPEEENAVTISHNAYIKRLPLNTYRSQHRGGRGVSGGSTA